VSTHLLVAESLEFCESFFESHICPLEKVEPYGLTRGFGLTILYFYVLLEVDNIVVEILFEHLARSCH
jgi:hypothetical protein